VIGIKFVVRYDDESLGSDIKNMCQCAEYSLMNIEGI